MSDQPQASLSREVFPVDIWLIIFRAIPDIPTLKALALTSSDLLKIFTRNASSFSFAVLCKEIPVAILPEAIAAWSSSKIKPWNKYGGWGFLKHYHANREAQLNQSWTLNKAREVSKLYQCCRFFASEFSAAALSENPKAGLTPSRLESNRIERSFLRFELYCNIFRKQFPSQKSKHRFSPEQQREMYLKYYADWENEQLACVHDCLFRRLSIPFNDLALHDVEWGKNEVDIVADHSAPGSSRKEYILSLGLAFLQDVVGAQTYERRRELLGSGLISDDRFLHASLSTRDQIAEAQNSMLFTMGSSEPVAKPFFQDDDNTGPREAWAWAHRTPHPQIYTVAHNLKFYNLRVWGYCWWDIDRLTRLGVFDSYRDGGKIVVYCHHIWMPKELRSSAEQQSKSWKQRSKIWRRGGRGWWAEGDNSKIIWDRAKRLGAQRVTKEMS